jgi:uncharacterized membrane protein HdeD (DUF308 family)
VIALAVEGQNKPLTQEHMDGASLLVIRGIVGLVFGLIAFAWPAVTIAALVVIFGCYAIIDGVTNLIMGLTRTATHGRSWARLSKASASPPGC